ncbi:MAG: hypothetical protein Q7V20_18865, partial [Aquabacterium sp.]|nr:hypothetical protein [Aquabacterium sp.]
MKSWSKAAAVLAVAGCVATPVMAKSQICVWDVAGKSGDVTSSAVDYLVAMQKHGVEMEVKNYVDERVAIEEFRSGQCDAVIATTLRT